MNDAGGSRRSGRSPTVGCPRRRSGSLRGAACDSVASAGVARFSTSRKRPLCAGATHHRPEGEVVHEPQTNPHPPDRRGQSGFQASTGARLYADPRLPSCKRQPRGRRRPIPSNRTGRARLCRCFRPRRGCGRSLCWTRCDVGIPSSRTICAVPWNAGSGCGRPCTARSGSCARSARSRWCPIPAPWR